MKIAKQFSVEAPQAQVWDFITNPEKVAPCIPGCEGVEVVGNGKYRASVKLQTGPIKATFKLTITTTEERAPEFASYRTEGDEGGRSSRINATSTLTIEPIADKVSQVTYTSDIAIAGRFGKFGAGVMTKIADKMNDKFIDAVRASLNDETAC